ncbi:MAG: hypothetical protein RLZZ238_642 [Planctomycetota bacterium]
MLLVEDDESLREALVAALDGAGIGCHACASAEDALEVWRERSFEVVVTDLRLPQLDGVSFLEELRRSEVVPAIVLTGFRADYESRMAELDGLKVLEKPIEAAAFLCVVSRLLVGEAPKP